MDVPQKEVFDIQGKSVGKIDLSDEVFGVAVNEAAMHQVVKMQLANKRQGTQSAKTRAEINLSTRKPWRQKGTGRARQGSRKAPNWTKGGVVFAPKPRDYSFSVPKKIKRLALKSALSAKVRDNQIVVLDSLELKEPKTKEMVKVLTNLKIDGKVMVVLEGKKEDVARASGNIPGLTLGMVNTLNVLDILNHDVFLITTDAVKQVEEVYA